MVLFPVFGYELNCSECSSYGFSYCFSYLKRLAGGEVKIVLMGAVYPHHFLGS